MVFGTKPECCKCKATDCAIWHKEGDEILCTSCANPDKMKENSNGKKKGSDDNEINKDDKDMEVDQTKEGEDGTSVNNKDKKDEGDEDKDRCSDKKEIRRKTRKGRQGGKGSVPKGKGRRYIFKKSATRAPAAVATPVTSDFLFYKGSYYQVGDIVSVIDIDGGTFYAQIRGLLQDQYCEKSAVLTWLLPTKNSPTPDKGFHASTYIIGPEEDIPRKLEYMDFVCHAPSDYYKDRSSPYSTFNYQPQSCFVWSRLGPQIKPIEKAAELMAKWAKERTRIKKSEKEEENPSD